MGAVFAIFSAFYFWFEKITGKCFSEIWARIHFWTFFIGVNLTFFPMHFLGIAGMPRRISTYPYSYAGFNFWASFGSAITMISVIIFFIGLIDAYVNTEKNVKKNPNFYKESW
jgi:heme/copper-type cytochrome/quinol oxidase subunit 1